MNEYQSAELHFGALRTYYDSYVDGWPDNIPLWSQPPHTTGINGVKIKKFDESAFSGGLIAFIDNEDISFYEDKLNPVPSDESESEFSTHYSDQYQGWCGPPVEIDRKYLGMLLGAKKLKTSLDLNFYVSVPEDYNSELASYTDIQGKVEGSFNELRLDAFHEEYSWDIKYRADWYSKDTTSKAAQLNSSDKKIKENSAGLDDNIVTSPSDYFPYLFVLSGAQYFDKLALPSIEYNSAFFFPVDRDEDNNYIPADPINCSVNASHILAGDFSLNSIVKGSFDSYLAIRCSVGFIVVTPTKVHLFPVISGGLVVSIEGTGINFTAVKRDTYEAYDTLLNTGDVLSLPPVATSQITFLGAQVPVYFYYQSFYESVGWPVHEGASCAGTSFDISVEEEY